MSEPDLTNVTVGCGTQNRRLANAQSRALWRLAHDYPEQFRAYVAEEMSKG